MPKLRLLLTGFVFSAALPVLGLAQEATEDKVIAIVNGHEIRTSEVAMASDDIVGQLPDLPPKMRFPFVVEYLIERHLLAQRAVSEGIADTGEYKRRLALYQAKALRDAYFFQKIRPQVTDAEIKLAYDEEASKVQQTERMRARHILVGSEKEATEIAGRLAAGEKFEDLAKKYSLDGSKEFGGDLGYFTEGEMVAEFSAAAKALKPGEVSGPVKTDFGWHLIKLEDRKVGGAQPFEQVKGAVRNVLVRKKVAETVAEMRKAAKIEILDEELKKLSEEAARKRQEQLLKQSGGGAAPAGGDPAATGGKSDLQIPE